MDFFSVRLLVYLVSLLIFCCCAVNFTFVA
jgi:hypothetical protein